MGSIGLRAGYRIWAPVAAEFMLDYGKLDVKDAKSDDSATPRHYSLGALRFGPNLRLMTTGKKLRFSSTIGAGAVHHKLVLDPVATDPSLTGGTRQRLRSRIFCSSSACNGASVTSCSAPKSSP